MSEAFGDRGHVNVTSYNRMVLLTGEVPTEADKTDRRAGRRRASTTSRSVVNELTVGPPNTVQRALQRHAASPAR